jgi:hypothetical protein
MIPELRRFTIPELHRFTIPELRRFMITGYNHSEMDNSFT